MACARPLGAGLVSLLTTHRPRATCTVKVLTKLKATDGGAATTIPQVRAAVCGWVAHSPTQRTVHLWTLPHAPLRQLCASRLLRAVRLRLRRRQGAVRRGQELRDRDAGAPLATTVPLCVPTLVHTFLSGCMRLLSCCAVHISIPPEYYISGRVPQGGRRGRRQDGSDTRCDPGGHAHININAGAAGPCPPRAHRLSHAAPSTYIATPTPRLVQI